MSQSSEALWKYFNSVNQMFRGDKACPWLKTQTHESLFPYLKEEVGELMAAIRKPSQNPNPGLEAIDELGDLWLQSVLHLILLSESSGRSVATNLDSWTQKIVDRHPHVFDPVQSQKSWTLEEVLLEWRNRKKSEKLAARKNNNLASKTSDFLEYSSCLSELVRSHKIGERSGQHNFDWNEPAEVLDKISEELQELKDEMHSEKTNQPAIKEELGDLLFSVVQLARHLGISSEEALALANDKFINRFETVEKQLQSKDPARASGDWKAIPRDELEEQWKQAKSELRSRRKT